MKAQLKSKFLCATLFHYSMGINILEKMNFMCDYNKLLINYYNENN